MTQQPSPSSSFSHTTHNAILAEISERLRASNGAPYLGGHRPGPDDVRLFRMLLSDDGESPGSNVALYRWAKHIASFPQKERQAWPAPSDGYRGLATGTEANNGTKHADPQNMPHLVSVCSDSVVSGAAVSSRDKNGSRRTSDDKQYATLPPDLDLDLDDVGLIEAGSDIPMFDDDENETREMVLEAVSPEPTKKKPKPSHSDNIVFDVQLADGADWEELLALLFEVIVHGVVWAGAVPVPGGVELRAVSERRSCDRDNLCMMLEGFTRYVRAVGVRDWVCDEEVDDENG